MTWHVFTDRISLGTDTAAFWSVNPTRRTLIVFVHGFGSNAVSSWSEFDSSFLSNKKVRGCDLLFYGYNSLNTPTQQLADSLLQDLNALNAKPHFYANAAAPGIGRSNRFKYDRIVVVAHSLGAVVARAAVLRATVHHKKWARNCSLVFFAPAYNGAKALVIGQLLFGGIQSGLQMAVPAWGNAAKILVAVAKGLLPPALKDLLPQSIFLTDLKADTKQAVNQGAPHLAAKGIVICDPDLVVNNGGYLIQDAPEKPVTGSSHSLVCKPGGAYRLPFQIVAGAI